MNGEPLSYGDLAEHLRRVGVMPRYTLHACPAVIAALRAKILGDGEPLRPGVALMFGGVPQLFDNIDVFPERDWPRGRYELRRNGVMCLEGTLRLEEEETDDNPAATAEA